jgi:hypothetical protein
MPRECKLWLAVNWPNAVALAKKYAYGRIRRQNIMSRRVAHGAGLACPGSAGTQG